MRKTAGTYRVSGVNMNNKHDSGQYKLDYIVVVQVDRNHIPFLGYGVLEGPRGGKTLIDLFGLEIIMKKNRRFTRCIIEKLLMSYCYTTGRVVVVNDLDTSDSGLKAIANKSKMRSCIRLTNRKKLENITTDFDYSDIERVMGHAIY